MSTLGVRRNASGDWVWHDPNQPPQTPSGAAARDAVFAIDGVVDVILQYAVGGWRRAHWGSVLDAPRDDGRWFHAQYVEPERSDAPYDNVRTFRSAPELSNVVVRGGKLAAQLRDVAQGLSSGNTGDAGDVGSVGGVGGGGNGSPFDGGGVANVMRLCSTTAEARQLRGGVAAATALIDGEGLCAHYRLVARVFDRALRRAVRALLHMPRDLFESSGCWRAGELRLTGGAGGRAASHVPRFVRAHRLMPCDTPFGTEQSRYPGARLAHCSLNTMGALSAILCTCGKSAAGTEADDEENDGKDEGSKVEERTVEATVSRDMEGDAHETLAEEKGMEIAEEEIEEARSDGGAGGGVGDGAAATGTAESGDDSQAAPPPATNAVAQSDSILVREFTLAPAGQPNAAFHNRPRWPVARGEGGVRSFQYYCLDGRAAVTTYADTCTSAGGWVVLQRTEIRQLESSESGSGSGSGAAAAGAATAAPATSPIQASVKVDETISRGTVHRFANCDPARPARLLLVQTGSGDDDFVAAPSASQQAPGFDRNARAEPWLVGPPEDQKLAATAAVAGGREETGESKEGGEGGGCDCCARYDPHVPYASATLDLHAVAQGSMDGGVVEGSGGGEGGAGGGEGKGGDDEDARVEACWDVLKPAGRRLLGCLNPAGTPIGRYLTTLVLGHGPQCSGLQRSGSGGGRLGGLVAGAGAAARGTGFEWKGIDDRAFSLIPVACPTLLQLTVRDSACLECPKSGYDLLAVQGLQSLRLEGCWRLNNRFLNHLEGRWKCAECDEEETTMNEVVEDECRLCQAPRWPGRGISTVVPFVDIRDETFSNGELLQVVILAPSFEGCWVDAEVVDGRPPPPPPPPPAGGFNFAPPVRRVGTHLRAIKVCETERCDRAIGFAGNVAVNIARKHLRRRSFFA